MGFSIIEIGLPLDLSVPSCVRLSKGGRSGIKEGLFTAKGAKDAKIKKICPLIFTNQHELFKFIRVNS
jgi:hypothetical protein